MDRRESSLKVIVGERAEIAHFLGDPGRGQPGVPQSRKLDANMLDSARAFEELSARRTFRRAPSRGVLRNE